jgi:hypothetical protein
MTLQWRQHAALGFKFYPYKMPARRYQYPVGPALAPLHFHEQAAAGLGFALAVTLQR